MFVSFLIILQLIVGFNGVSIFPRVLEIALEIANYY
jgi:hypothetical protein